MIFCQQMTIFSYIMFIWTTKYVLYLFRFKVPWRLSSNPQLYCSVFLLLVGIFFSIPDSHWLRTKIKHFRQCSGSVTLWYGSGSFWLTDPAPDPALFVSDLQDANKKYYFFQSFLLFEDTFTSFFKDKKSQRSHRTEVALLFLLDDGGIRIRIWTNPYDYDSDPGGL